MMLNYTTYETCDAIEHNIITQENIDLFKDFVITNIEIIKNIVFCAIIMYKSFSTNVNNVYNYTITKSQSNSPDFEDNLYYYDKNYDKDNYYTIILPGWSIIRKKRQNGKSKGKYDTYYIPICEKGNRVYRSKSQLSKRFKVEKVISVKENDRGLVLKVQ